MKDYIWSVKLAAAIGLLVASTALAAPDADKNGATAPTGTPQPGHIVVIKSSDDGEVVELKGDLGRPSEVPPQADRLQVRPLPPGDKSLLVDPQRPRELLGKYWIGVRCGPVPPGLREHLDLPRGQGLYVLEVVPGTPAAKAGIAPTDILLAANGAALAGAGDLIKAVDEAKEKPLSIELIHKGAKTRFAVTPEVNPHGAAQATSPGKLPPYDELDRIYEWCERQYPGRGLRPPMRLGFMHPGTILPPDAPMHPALPGTMSITIMKKGDEPTQITVTRDKDVWKVDEKGLDALPADIRPHVERMLRGLVIGPDVLVPRFDYPPDRATPGIPSGKPGPSLRDRIEERMDQMNQRLQEMQERIERILDQQGPEEKK